MIKVLVVDDSAFMRQIFKKAIDKQPDMNVIAIARNGEDAINKIEKYTPDIITLDIEMPKKNGLETLKELKNKEDFNIPIIMVSALDNSSTVMEALDLGAFDFIPKPSRSISTDIDEVIDSLIEKIKGASNSNREFNIETKEDIVSSRSIDKNIGDFPIVAVGTSSGGPKALKKLLLKFPKNFPGSIIVVQHMPEGFTKSFAKRLNRLADIEIIETEDGEKIEKGKVYIAPGGYHLEIVDGNVSLNKNPRKWGVRPSVDYMMETAAQYYSSRVIGVILTGMGNDGGAGMKEIKNNGGYCIVQDKESSLVYGMPQAAINEGAYDEICSLNEIPGRIMDVIERKF